MSPQQVRLPETLPDCRCGTSNHGRRISSAEHFHRQAQRASAQFNQPQRLHMLRCCAGCQTCHLRVEDVNANRSIKLLRRHCGKSDPMWAWSKFVCAPFRCLTAASLITAAQTVLDIPVSSIVDAGTAAEALQHDSSKLQPSACRIVPLCSSLNCL